MYNRQRDYKDPSENRYKKIKLSQSAQYLIESGKYELALSMLREAVNQYANESIFYGQITKCCLELNLPEEAEFSARRCWELTQNCFARGHLTQALIAQKKFTEAEELARSGISLMSNVMDYILLGQVLLHAGKIDEAEKTMRESVAYFNDAHSMCFLSKILLMQNKFNESVSLARQALSADSEAIIYNALLQALIFTGQFMEAERIAEEALAKFDNPITYALLAEVYRKRGLYLQCLKLINDKRLNDNSALLCKSYCLMAMSEFEKAFESFCSVEIDSTEVIRHFDINFRLMNGFIFLYEKIVKTESKVPPAMWQRLKTAVDWLKSNKESKRGYWQERDYSQAMELIQRFNF